MTRKWFLTVTWIHIWPPSYCSFLVGEEKRNRETDGAKGPSLLFSKVWNGCCPSWIHQDRRSCGRNPKGEKRWSRKEGIRRGGGNPQSVFVKIPKRPLTVLRERGGRTTELGDPGPSSVLWMLFLLLLGVKTGAIQRYVCQPAFWNSSQSAGDGGMLDDSEDEVGQNCRRLQKKQFFCWVLWSGHWLTGKSGGFQSKGNQLRNMKLIGMFVWNVFFFLKKNQYIATYTCPC